MKSLLIILFFLFCSFGLYAQNQDDTLKVFYLKGCIRCEQTQEFLKNNQIPNKEYYFHNESDQNLMGRYLNQIGFKKGQRLEFPVVVRGKEVFLNITNLDAFLDNLKGGKGENGNP